MSALSPAPGVRWANLLTPLESALADCCLSYKQDAPVSPLESALTNASYLLDSTCFETACFDTLAQTSPASSLESALTKTPGVVVAAHRHSPLPTAPFAFIFLQIPFPTSERPATVSLQIQSSWPSIVLIGKSFAHGLLARW